MKSKIHPKWYPKAKVTCTCGNTMVLGATVPQIQTEVCSACHPFYTGQMKYVDTAGRVDAFKTRSKKAQKKVLSKRDKRRLKRERKIQKELEKPGTLKELRKRAKEKNKKASKKKVTSSK